MKKIIFCADGTWNGPQGKTGVSALNGSDSSGELSSGAVTNVVKLFSNLAGQVTPESLVLHNEQEKNFTDQSGTVRQVAKYVHGVGDSSNLLVKCLGGTLGLGVIERVVRGYTFISRSYCPGDEIYLAGFSRGAYTARALSGMIAKIGLLNPRTYDVNDKMEAYRLGFAAWSRSKSISLEGAGKLTQLATHMLNFVQSFIASDLPPDGLIPNVPIKTVAVWDTVGSMGIPAYVGDERFDVLRFVDNTLSDKVEYGFHAMAIDEIRRDFPVTKWNERQKIEQTWFTGAHSDVGGGYPIAESRLSDEALGWMIKKLGGLGVEFVTPLGQTPDCKICGQAIHTPWEEFPFSSVPTNAREVGAEDVIHASVVQRWNEDASYRPDSMATFREQGIGGVKVDNTTFP